jgi:hypothetical protein
MAIAAVLIALLALDVRASAASCVGPQIDYSVDSVSPGQVVRVTGMYWGTDCYDTGDSRRDSGALGQPQHDIEVLVLQDQDGPVVARGSADRQYRFTVDVLIPGPLRPGTITIAARASNPLPQVAVGPEVPVTNPAATVPSLSDPAPFEPSQASATSSTRTKHLALWLIAGAVVLGAAVIGGLWLQDRHRTRRLRAPADS